MRGQHVRGACLLLLAVAAESGCGESPSPDALAADAPPEQLADAGPDSGPDSGLDSATPFVPCPGAEEPGPTGLVGDDLRRFATAGTVDVTVVFCNPLIPQPLDELLFFVILADHYLGLAPSDITSSATWVTASGDPRSDGPFMWYGDDLSQDDGEHHLKGRLHVPGRTAEGVPLIGPGTTYLELTLGGLGGDGQVVVRWEQPYLR